MIEKTVTPKDLPKVEGKPASQMYYEIHFKNVNGVVTIIIHPPGKPEFPLYRGSITAPHMAFAEFAEALK